MIMVDNLSKIYKVYENPKDRLVETLIKNRKKHKIFHALKNVSFEIKKGETVGIIGRNGSGKSTLLKILSGVLMPSEGEISVEGRVSAILELGAGFNTEYTGMENIYLNGTLQGKTKKEIDGKLEAILDFADIGEFIHQPVKTYSSGMFARLAFAVAINVDPDVLIIDEALAVGDMKFQTKCFQKFEEMKNNGVTILFVGHDISSIRKFCDRTMWLHKGGIVIFGNTLEVTSEYMEFMNSEDPEEELAPKQVEQETQNIQDIELAFTENIINRWGSQPHLIKKVKIINEKGQFTQTIKHGEIVRINIGYDFPETESEDEVSIAISLKNNMGLDLLVYTTKDDKDVQELTGTNEITFEFVNYFTDVELILVVAIEDRSTIHPQYYDYIEGAGYLKSITDTQLFGIIHPPVRKHFS